jgi:deoxyribodipyrimidine photo-lyase
MSERRVVWFRDDLRIADNPALHAACAGPTVAVFLRSEAQWRSHGVGGRRLSFLRRSLERLAVDLARLRIPFKLLDVPHFNGAAHALRRFCAELGARELHFNAEYPLDEARRDAEVSRTCEADGVRACVHHGGTVHPPGTIVTAADRPYTVFTPFKRRWLDRLTTAEREPLPPPRKQRALPIESDAIAPFAGETHDVDDRWPAGEHTARDRLDRFVERALANYATARNLPAVDGTSRLSPHLAIGALSARQCLAAIGRRRGPDRSRG